MYIPSASGSGPLPIAYAAQHLSLFSRVLPLSVKSNAHRFTVDFDYRLDDDPPKDIHPSFFELFGTTVSEAHYDHIVQMTQRWTWDQAQFKAAGSRAKLSVILVSAVEATLLALLLAGFFSFIRKGLRANRRVDLADGDQQ